VEYSRRDGMRDPTRLGTDEGSHLPLSRILPGGAGRSSGRAHARARAFARARHRTRPHTGAGARASIEEHE
jgi:hypothetical protein